MGKRLFGSERHWLIIQNGIDLTVARALEEFGDGGVGEKGGAGVVLHHLMQPHS